MTTEIGAQSDSLVLIQSLEQANTMLNQDFPKALSICLALNERAAASTCMNCRQRSLLLLGKAFWINGEYTQAIDLLKQGKKLAQQSEDFDQWASAANKIALNYYYQAYYDTAISYFQEAFAIYKRSDDKPGMALVLANISLMYHRKGDYQKTVEYLLRSEEIDETLQEHRSLGDFPGMENVFSDSLYFREKISDNLQALKARLNKGVQSSVDKIYFNLGVAYSQLKEYITAARYYKKAYTLYEKAGIRPYWNDVAVSYRNANMKDSAFYYHDKARQGFGKATQLNILSAYEVLGDTYFHFKQYDSALHNYAIALAMNMNCNNRITIAGMHRKMADTYIMKGLLNKAEEHIKSGITLAKEVSMQHQRSLFESAARLYSKKRNYELAFYYESQYASLVDSLSKAETALNLTRLLAQYKTAKKERELSNLKIQQEKSDLVLRNRNLTLTSLAVATLASLIFITVFRRQRNKITKKNVALDLANKEQEFLIKEMHHRVKNNLQIISSLINLKAIKSSSETREVLCQLNGRIYAMGLIHEKLYQKNDLQRVALDAYLIELGRYMLDTFDGSEKSVELKTTCEVLQIDVDNALTCGLIVNELITNSLKYAFPNEQRYREVKIELASSSGMLVLTVSDNGENNIEPNEGIKQNFGLRFVDQLVRAKLNGNWSIQEKNGFCVSIKFPNT